MRSLGLREDTAAEAVGTPIAAGVPGEPLLNARGGV
jgi:hypothetical protein